jgi:dipeptidyl aminopeptidase/acylaminoacyl peptidase
MRPQRLILLTLTSALLFPSLGQAQNRLPVGSHDGFEGGLHNFVCTADGWAVDPDDRDVDLQVRVLANGVVVGEGIANQFRPDLETSGVCPGGTCAYRFLLWGRITALAPYAIRLEARDAQTGNWSALASTPKMVRCFGFTLTTFDLKTREARVETDLPYVAGHFGPSWSPDGREIAYTVVGWRTFPTDFITQLHITNLESGLSEPIPGGECGGNAVWSPDGEQMAFEGLCDLPFGISVGPPRGTERRLIRPGAFHPDWSPDGRRLVFVAAEDLSLRTIDVKTGREKVLRAFGVRPAWSPNGHWIAFQSLDFHLWKIRVTRAGAPVGDPIQLTSGPLVQGRPAWSRNSQTIYFHSETRTPGTDAPLFEELHIWQMSASGGRLRDLTEETGMGVDVASWQNGRRLVYGGSPLRP